MNPRDLHELLQSAAAAVPEPNRKPAGLAQQVWERIEQGWDPEFNEWQRWVKRLAPWACLLVVAVTLTVALLPHGTHETPRPPSLSLFSEPAGEFEISPKP